MTYERASNEGRTLIQDEKIERALSGLELYGDDLSVEELQAWFDDEVEGYFNQWVRDTDAGQGRGTYSFAGLAAKHGYNYLPLCHVSKVLGVGSGDGY